MTDIDLDLLRGNALQANEERARRRREAQARLPILVEEDLSEWVRVIQAAISSGQHNLIIKYKWKFDRGIAEWNGWENDSAPCVNLSEERVPSRLDYLMQLLSRLGAPFYIEDWGVSNPCVYIAWNSAT